MTILQRRLLFVAALLMCCASQRLFAVEDKSQYHDPKFSYDFVPYILRALADYRSCEPGDLQCLCHVQAIRKNLEPYKDNGIKLNMMRSLADLMLYLPEHDGMAEEIDERVHQFVWLYLRMNDVQCYCWKLPLEYVKLLTYQVHQEPDFVEVSNERSCASVSRVASTKSLLLKITEN